MGKITIKTNLPYIIVGIFCPDNSFLSKKGGPTFENKEDAEIIFDKLPKGVYSLRLSLPYHSGPEDQGTLFPMVMVMNHPIILQEGDEKELVYKSGISRNITFESVFAQIQEINKLDPASHSDRIAKLLEEAGELAKEVNKMSGRKIRKPEDTDKAVRQNICDEAGDTIQNVISTIEVFGITPQDVLNSIAKGNNKWVEKLKEKKESV